ncbi:MAG: hypothetical protein WKF96_23955, partial [Solirubrobacteraceae bacterium]
MLDQRQLDRWVFATRLGVRTKCVADWLARKSTPKWPVSWRAADLLDVPVWWWRCGGYDEMDLCGPFELCSDASRPPDEAYGLEFARGAQGCSKRGARRSRYPGKARRIRGRDLLGDVRDDLGRHIGR